MIDPGRSIVTKIVQPRVDCVDCEIVTKYSPIFFANLDEYFVNLCINNDQIRLLRDLSKGINGRQCDSPPACLLIWIMSLSRSPYFGYGM